MSNPIQNAYQSPISRCPRCGKPLGYPPMGGPYGCIDLSCRIRAATEAAQEKASASSEGDSGNAESETTDT